MYAKNYRKRSLFEKVMAKIKRCSFFLPHSVFVLSWNFRLKPFGRIKDKGLDTACTGVSRLIIVQHIMQLSITHTSVQLHL